jgi:hypothetical protein
MGPKQFTNHLRQVIWPRGFKLEKLNHYDGKVNPELWVQLYETACRSAMGDEHVMANYFPVVVGPIGHEWLVSLPENHFDSWYALRQAFVKNFIATCEQLGNKYDLQRIHDARDEPLREYIRRFSDMRIRIPRITDNEAIEAFIIGLRYHNNLRDKLLHKRPITVVDLLTTAKKYADADDAKKLLNEDTDKAPYSPRCDDYHDNRRYDDFSGRSDIRDCRNDNRDRRDNRNQHDDRRDNFKGKRAHDDDGEVNAVKNLVGIAIMKKTTLKP